jgi:kynurenine formamidase
MLEKLISRDIINTSELQFIDLSLTLEPTIGEPIPVEIEYIDHAKGADILGFPIGIGREEFPESMGLSLEHVKLTTHSGTHIDAPAHYGPICEGQPSKTIENLSLDWFFRPGVLIDCRGGDSEQAISSDELKEQLSIIGYEIQPFDIVLLQTDSDKNWNHVEYFTSFRGVSLEATQWLVSQGVKVIGVDSFGFDPPFQKMLNDYQKNSDPNFLWPSHFYGRKKEYCQIERLANLDKIPYPKHFMVSCFPIKVKNSGAGWTRVIALCQK